jgi:hypothetical protein
MVGRVVTTQFLAGLLFLGATAGCGRPPKTGCEGEVSYRGVRVAAGSIRFFPSGGTPGIGGSARIEDGRYTIPAGRGLAAGAYVVAISAARPTGRNVRPEPGHEADGPIAETEQFIPERFNTSSELKVELEPGENRRDFNLSPP